MTLALEEGGDMLIRTTMTNRHIALAHPKLRLGTCILADQSPGVAKPSFVERSGEGCKAESE